MKAHDPAPPRHFAPIPPRAALARPRRAILAGAALLLLLPACSRKQDGADATLFVPEITLRFSAARTLTLPQQSEIVPEYELTDPELVPAPLIFGSGRVESIDLREPVILRRQGATWKFVELPQLNHTEWVYAGASCERDELWAILDSTMESPGAGLYLFRSTDHGETWEAFSGVRPPTLSAEFVEFTMTEKGIGRLTVHQDDDAGAPRGLYAYASNDGGKTWTGPAFTADDLISADTPLKVTLAETLQDLDPDATHPATSPPVATRPPVAPPIQRGRGRGPAETPPQATVPTPGRRGR